MRKNTGPRGGIRLGDEMLPQTSCSSSSTCQALSLISWKRGQNAREGQANLGSGCGCSPSTQLPGKNKPPSKSIFLMATRPPGIFLAF